MKKRNLLLVILAVLLVFGMVMGCGPAEEEEEEEQTPVVTGPDLDDEATYFGTYEAVYEDSQGRGIKETIIINEEYFYVSDTKAVAGSTTPSTEASGDYLKFSIKDWDNTVTSPSITYPHAFKFTGTITAAKPTTDNLYGSQTSPGLTNADITGSTLCQMFLYFDYKDGAITFIRTRFNKVSGGSADNDKVVNWATTGTNADKPREYTFKSKTSTIP